MSKAEINKLALHKTGSLENRSLLVGFKLIYVIT